MLLDVGEGRGAADEANLAGALQVAQRRQHVFVPDRLHRWADVQLHEVEVVRLHPAQTLVHPGQDVRAAEVVRVALPWRGRRSSDQAAALGREDVLVPTMRDVLTDELLRRAVVDRGVDVVDPLVQHIVQHSTGLFGRNRSTAAARRAAQLHGSKAENRRVDAGAPEAPSWNVAHIPSVSLVSANLTAPTRRGYVEVLDVARKALKERL